MSDTRFIVDLDGKVTRDRGVFAAIADLKSLPSLPVSDEDVAKAKLIEDQARSKLEAAAAKFTGSGIPPSSLRVIKPIEHGSAYLAEWNGILVLRRQLHFRYTANEQAFSEDLKSLTALRHPNILLIATAQMESEYHGSGPCYITELCQRGTLHDILHGSETRGAEAKEVISDQRAWSLLLQLARALSFLHGKRIVHRDVKSANCFVSASWTLKIGGFEGEALRVDRRTATIKRESPPNFIAPEQLESRSQVTVSSDIWHFGGVMIDVLTKQAPFTGLGEFEIVRRLSHRQHPPELELLQERKLVDFVKHCLSFDPSARPTAAAAVAFCEEQLSQYTRQTPDLAAIQQQLLQARIVALEREREQERKQRERERELERKQREEDRRSVERLLKQLAQLKVPEVAEAELTELAFLGEGGFKSASLCQWKGTKVVQLKLRKTPAIIKEFNLEFAVLNKLRHDNIVHLLAQTRPTGTQLAPSFITEFCERGSLHQVLRLIEKPVADADVDGKESILVTKKDELTDRRKWSILCDVAAGLVYLHGQNLVHRDIKSGNVFITRGFQGKIGDFGLVKTLRLTSSIPKEHGAGGGTANFKALEQTDKKMDDKVGAPADIYGFGGVAIDLLSGQEPWKDHDSLQILRQLLIPKPPPELALIKDKEVREFIGSCMNVTNPLARPNAQTVLLFCQKQLAIAQKIENAIGGEKSKLEQKIDKGFRDVADRVDVVGEYARTLALAHLTFRKVGEVKAFVDTRPPLSAFSSASSPTSSTSSHSSSSSGIGLLPVGDLSASPTASAARAYASIEAMSEDDVKAWLSSNAALKPFAAAFHAANVNGAQLSDLSKSDDDLKELGLKLGTQKKAFRDALAKLQSAKKP